MKVAHVSVHGRRICRGRVPHFQLGKFIPTLFTGKYVHTEVSKGQCE